METKELLKLRAHTHGDFAVVASVAHNLKKTMVQMLGASRLSHVQGESLNMIANKIGRILAGDPNFKDHWEDIAGYATLAAESCPDPDAYEPSGESAKP